MQITAGLFDPIHRTVFKSYYAFAAFNELYLLQNQAACTVPDEKDIIPLAAISEEGEAAAILVTNMNPVPVQVVCTLAPASGRRIAGITCLATDTSHAFTETKTFQFDAAQHRLICDLPEHSFYLFRVRMK